MDAWKIKWIVVKLNNFFFSELGIDFKGIYENEEGLVEIVEKGKKKKIEWWKIYYFRNQESYDRWKGKCFKELGQSYFGEELEKQFELFDILWGPPQPYLFNGNLELL